MHQLVQFVLVIIENSAYFVGDVVFSHMWAPVLTNVLNHYQWDVNDVRSPIPGQNVTADFALDWRQTANPLIGDGYLDSWIVGDLMWAGNSYQQCNIQHEKFDFMDKKAHSQLVVTQSAASCLMNSLGASEIGHLDFNERRLRALFKVEDLYFDTTSFA